MLRYHYDEDMRGLALTFLQENYDYEDVTVLWTSLNSYLFQENGFDKLHFSSPNLTISSITWWRSCLCEPAHYKLKTLAIRLLSMPASSAASERNWSAHRFIHSPRRNRLASIRVHKLVFVYSNHKLREATLRGRLIPMTNSLSNKAQAKMAVRPPKDTRS